MVLAAVIGGISVLLGVVGVIGASVGVFHSADSATLGILFFTLADLLLAASMVTGAILGFLKHADAVRVLWITCWIGCAHMVLSGLWNTSHPVSRDAQIRFQLYPALCLLGSFTGALVGASIRYGIVMFLLWKTQNKGQMIKAIEPRA